MELRPYQTDLVNDIRKAINSGKHSVCAVLGCGGGKSVIIAEIAKLTTKGKHRVLFLVHRKELCAQISNTFRLAGVDMNYCSVMMVQTASRRLRRLEEPALIIVDECHHILSNSYIRILDNFPSALTVGFTATPQRMNEGGLGKVFEQLIESVSTRWLIDNHYLAPYRYYSIQLVDSQGLHVRRGDYDQKELEALMSKSVVWGDAVKNWKKFADGKKTIVYCNSINSSQKVIQAFTEAGIPAAHLDGTTPPKVREATVKAFRDGRIKVLSNVDLFGEGFDVPDCEAVILLRPTKSLTLHIQQSMRSMRFNPKDPNKTAIILDHVGNWLHHGLPDQVHEWSLESKKKKQEHGELSVKQCPNCFAVLLSKEEKCSMCGYEFPKEERAEQKVVSDVELEEIRQLDYQSYQECKNWAELDVFRQAKRYHIMWAIHKAGELKIPLPAKYKWMCLKTLKRYEYEKIKEASGW